MNPFALSRGREPISSNELWSHFPYILIVILKEPFSDANQLLRQNIIFVTAWWHEIEVRHKRFVIENLSETTEAISYHQKVNPAVVMTVN